MFLMSNDDAKIHRFLHFKTTDQKYKYWTLMLHSYFESDKSKEREEEAKNKNIKRLNTKDNNFLLEKSWQSESLDSIHKPNEYFEDDSFFRDPDEALVIPSNRQITHHIDFSSSFASSSSSSESENEQKSEQFPQMIKIKTIQLQIWRVLFDKQPNEIYNLWFKHFDVFQKVSLWNSLEFSSEFIKTQIDPKTKTESGKKQNHPKSEYLKKYDEILNF